MGVLIDSDFFRKLGSLGLLERVVELLGTRLEECQRLAALPYQLKKARAPIIAEHRDELLALAARIPIIQKGPADSRWIDTLSSQLNIDPGEQLLLARLARSPTLLLGSGDKRAFAEVSLVPELAPAIAGRVLSTEGALQLLLEHDGPALLAEIPAVPHDLDSALANILQRRTMRDVQEGLRSYLLDLERSAGAWIRFDAGAHVPPALLLAADAVK